MWFFVYHVYICRYRVLVCPILKSYLSSWKYGISEHIFNYVCFICMSSTSILPFSYNIIAIDNIALVAQYLMTPSLAPNFIYAVPFVHISSHFLFLFIFDGLQPRIQKTYVHFYPYYKLLRKLSWL